MRNGLHKPLIQGVAVVAAILGVNGLAAETRYLFQGLGVTRSCMESMISGPGPVTTRTGELLLGCAAQDYDDNDVLIVDPEARTCGTLEQRESIRPGYEPAIHSPETPFTGPLADVAAAIFQHDESAFLAFDKRTLELTRAGSTLCASPRLELPGELTQVAYLKASNIDANDLFGDKIAVSGTTVVVGAPREDGSATQVNGPDDDLAIDAGAAYVFARDPATGTWPQQAYLKASNAESGDRFGSAVAIDGDWAVVGAPNEDGDGNSDSIGGAAYVFARESGQWTEHAILRPWDTTNSSLFGSDVAISGDTVVVGAYPDDRAYVFVRNLSTGQWDQDTVLQGSNTEGGDSFGRGVAIDGNTIVVGAFAEDSDATGVNGPEDNDNAPRSGAAYVFVRSGSDWIQQAYLKASNTDPADQFGGAAGISGDTIVIGAYHEESPAVGIDGDQSNNLWRDAGAAYVFVRDGGSWSQQAYVKASNTGFLDTFAASVAISGNRLAIPAVREDSGDPADQGDNSSTDSGAAYLYGRQGGAWAQDAYIKPAPIGAGDWFGRDIAISGNVLAVGAMWEDSATLDDPEDNSAADSGAAYVFLLPADNGDPPPDEDTTPPTVTAPEDIVGFEAEAELTEVELGSASVTDDSGEALSAQPDETGPFPLGDTVVTWSAVDSAGNVGTDTQLVNIVDTIGPVVSAPDDIVVTASGSLTFVDIGQATAVDNTGPVASIVNDAPEAFTIGQTSVIWTATDLSGNSGMDTQRITVTPPEVVASHDSRQAVIDGQLSTGEWRDATRLETEHGFIAFKHDRSRLYVLINMLDDTGDDSFATGGGDQFWLYFDVDEDGSITPDVDFRFRLESGTGNLRRQTFCLDCPTGYNPLEPLTFSSRAEGFGCFFEDGSASIFPLRCNAHRVWELALDLGELGMRADRSARFGYLVASGAPSMVASLPADLNDMSGYASLSLESTVTSFGSAPGALDPVFEVTQAIQTTDNALDLVAGRRTAVRIYDPANESVVRNFIYGSRGGIDLPGSPLLDQSSLFSSFSNSGPRDSVVWNSFTTLPPAWSAGGTVDFEIRIQGMDGALVSTPFPLADSIEFVPTRTPVFWTVPIRNVFPDNVVAQPSAALITQAEQWLQTVAPIQDVEIVRRPTLSVFNITSSSRLKEVLNNYDQITIWTWLQAAQTGPPPFLLPEQTTGFTATSIGGIAGSSDRIGKGGRGRITWARQSTDPMNMTYLHELNHNLDRASSSTWGLHAPGCGSQSGGPVDGSWPYGNSVTIQDTGVVPTSVAFRSVDQRTPDLMSYCTAGSNPRRWWSPYRWQAWLDEFRSDGGGRVSSRGSGLPVPGGEPEDSFHILGRVYPDGSGEFVQVLREIGLPDPEITGVPYRVDVVDCSGNVVSSNGFGGSFIGDEGEAEEFIGFSMVVPAPAQACVIELWVDALPAALLSLSDQLPQVEILSPDGGEVLSGNRTVRWSAFHPEGAPLRFNVLYSADQGATWQLLAGLLEAPELEVDFSALPASETALMRVVAAGGGRSVFDDSNDVFTVAGVGPKVEILTPADGGVVGSETPVQLSGLARNASGLRASADDLLWWINAEPAGSGESITAYLPEGNHEAMLEVVEDGQVLAMDAIEFSVGGGAGTIGFKRDLQMVDEHDGEATLVVKRSGGVSGSATVLFFTMDETAISGGDPALGEDDYDAVADDPVHRIEWPDGSDADATISITINTDDVLEPPEQFRVLLAPFIQEALDSDVATVVIRDPDESIFESGFE